MTFNRNRSEWLVLASAVALAAASPVLARQEPERTDYRIELEELPNNLSPRSASRQLISRETTAQGTLDRWVVEAPSINGGYGLVFEVEEETIRIDDENSRFLRREFDTAPDGGRRLFRTVEEQRVERADGSSEVVRSLSEPDLNGRMRTLRQEVETTVQQSPGVYQTQTEVLVPGLNRGGFVPSERMEQTERRDSEDRVLDLDEMRYSNPVGGQGWMPLERRQVSYDYGEGETGSVERIYRPDGSGNLSLSDRVVHRTWSDPQGRERSSEEIYARDIPGLPRSGTPQLYRQLDIVTETGPNGSRETTRELREFQVDRMVVTERIIERTRPDGRGGTVTQREIQRRDANGRLRTVSEGSETESGL